MNKIILKGLDLTCYQEVLKNGLSVFIVPFDKVNGKYVTLSTPFNSTVLEFVPKGKTKYRKVHAGIAHFLEHATGIVYDSSVCLHRATYIKVNC